MTINRREFLSGAAGVGAALWLNPVNTFFPPSTTGTPPVEAWAGENIIKFSTYTVTPENNFLGKPNEFLLNNGDLVAVFASVPEAGGTQNIRNYYVVIGKDGAQGQSTEHRVDESWFVNGQFDSVAYFNQVLAPIEDTSVELDRQGLAPSRTIMRNMDPTVLDQVIIEGATDELYDDCNENSRTLLIMHNRSRRTDSLQEQAEFNRWFTHAALGHLFFAENKIVLQGSEALADALVLTQLPDLMKFAFPQMSEADIASFVDGQWEARAKEFDALVRREGAIRFAKTGDYPHAVFFATLFHLAGITDLPKIKQFMNAYKDLAYSSAECGKSEGMPPEFIVTAVDAIKEVEIADLNLTNEGLDGVITNVLRGFLAPHSNQEAEAIIEHYRRNLFVDTTDFGPNGTVYPPQGHERTTILKPGYFNRSRMTNFGINPKTKHLVFYKPGDVAIYSLDQNGTVFKIEPTQDLHALSNNVGGSLETIIYNTQEGEAPLTFFTYSANKSLYIPRADR